jgi:ABC-type phosphate transport system substrate-binding protein
MRLPRPERGITENLFVAHLKFAGLIAVWACLAGGHPSASTNTKEPRWQRAKGSVVRGSGGCSPYPLCSQWLDLHNQESGGNIRYTVVEVELVFARCSRGQLILQ